MADGSGGGGPDTNQQLLAMQSLINSSRGGAGGGAVCGILQDVNFANSLKMPGLPSEATFKPVAPPRPGLLAKILADMDFNGKAFLEAFQKCAQAGAVRESSHADLFGSGGPSGGFVASVSHGHSGPSGPDFV